MSAVKRDLSGKWQDAHRVLADRVDLDAARLVVDALHNREKSSMLYAMSLFQLIRKEKLSPEKMSILAYREDELKADSMDSLLDVPGGSSYREIEETLTDRGIVHEVQEILSLHLHDPSEDLNIRNAIPDVLSRLETQKAAEILCLELVQGTEDVRQSVIDALYKIHSNQPQIHLKKRRIITAVFGRINGSYEIFLSACDKQSAGIPSISDMSWKADLERATKQVFDLLTLVYPAEDIVKAYQNIQQGTRKSIDSSLELLDNVLDRDLKQLLFSLMEELQLEYKAGQLRKLRQSLEKRLN
jgi:hypothetical protein